MAKITPTKTQLLNQMRIDVGTLLIEIEDIFTAYSLPLTGITLIARDPANDKMFVLLTNEDEPGLASALALAGRPAAPTGTISVDGDWKGPKVNET